MARTKAPEYIPTCGCGFVRPDRAHWMWQCPSRPVGAAGAQLPTTLSKQKLAVPRVPYLRKAQKQEQPEEATERLAQALCETFATGARPVLATDGGSTGKTVWDRCGGWGAATGVTKVSGQLMGLDHSAYAAELRAAQIALAAIAKAQVPTTLIIDNLAVQKQIQRAIVGNKRLSSYFSSAWREL